MPKVREWKIARDTIGMQAAPDEVVTAEEFARFVDSLEDGFMYKSGDGLDWSPGYPFGRLIGGSTIPDDALYASNTDATLEAFEEYGLKYHIEADVGAGRITIASDSTHALALACRLERDFGSPDNYPVLDEQAYSDLQREMEEEAYKDYGFRDFVKALSDESDYYYAGEYAPLEWLFDEEEEDGLAAETREIFEPYIRRLAYSSVAYCGEMHPSEDAIRAALEEIVGEYMESPRLTVGQLAERLSHRIVVEKAIKEEEAFERTQPKIEGLVVPRIEEEE